MRPYLPVFTLLLAWAGTAGAQGVLLPEDKSLSPLTLLEHKVTIDVEDQVAVTKVEQTFKNPTDRQLEATYVFPVPKGASVNKFALWVDGKKISGELLKADDARKTYTDIVRRTQDPGLLEYVSNGLMRLRVFPIAPHAEQKLTLSFTSVAMQEGGTVEYVYPLKAEAGSATAARQFSLKATIKSQRGVQNVYSPSHAISVKHHGDREASISCQPGASSSGKDFQLFYTPGDKDVGLTALTYRPVSAEDGHFLMLLSPKVELSASQVVPRDVVFVVDTSGSMRGVKLEQAKKALKYCLGNLNKDDRFAVVNFCSTVNKYRDELVESSEERVENAKKWVERLEATSGTAINDALMAALDMRTRDEDRTFTVVFFTDGMPTEGECCPQKILKNVEDKTCANTRIFTFGVGDDVNASLLDQVAEQSRAVSTFVRPAEDIEAKVSVLYDKISHPVLANLKLTVGNDVHLSEVYPPKLPDLFHGGQLVVLGRYDGNGAAKVTLTGTVGKEKREFVFETNFGKKTGEEKAFVEQLWARRKVGYLLDQIRSKGENKELVDEVTRLAKKHGITTPYTSYLVVPDGAKLATGPGGGRPLSSGHPLQQAPGAMPPAAGAVHVMGDAVANNRPANEGRKYAPAWKQRAAAASPGMPLVEPATAPSASTPAYGGIGGVATAMPVAPMEAGEMQRNLRAASPEYYAKPDAKAQVMEQAAEALRRGDMNGYQSGRVGVELSVQLAEMRNQCRTEAAAVKKAAGRTCVEVGGVWIDDGFNARMKLVEIKAMSKAYFRIMEKHPEVSEVFQLGNHVVWVTPSGTALVLDKEQGKEELSDDEIEKLFATK